VLLAAVATAVLGSTILAVCEHALATIFFGSPDQGEPCPWDIVLAAMGGIITTYLLFWTPVMVVCGAVRTRQTLSKTSSGFNNSAKRALVFIAKPVHPRQHGSRCDGVLYHTWL